MYYVLQYNPIDSAVHRQLCQTLILCKSHTTRLCRAQYNPDTIQMEAFLPQMAVNFSNSKSIYPRPFYE
jgi:hypothetical protein